jgi:NAD(P)-dependent dehydrogenase (short-subunit alcohol dehydrogenase family)
MGTALITGAAKRVGSAIALGLAEAGWDIVLHFNKSIDEALALKKNIERLGNKVYLLQHDLSKLNEIEGLLPEITLDLLVNNASIFENDNLLEIEPELLLQHLKINFIAPIMLTKLFMSRSAGSSNPSIINILDNKIENSPKNFISYYLSKNALSYFTRVSAENLAPRIRVNGVALGYIIKNDNQSNDSFERNISHSLLKKIVLKKNLVDTISYLAHNENTTGNIIFLEN